MIITLKRVIVLVFIIYVVLTCYTAYVVLSKNRPKATKPEQKIWSLPEENDGAEWNPWGEELENSPVNFKEVKHARNDSQEKKDLAQHDSSAKTFSVEIWGKAAIGHYLWEHIFNGRLESKSDRAWSYGFKKIGPIKFKFRTGPGIAPTTVPFDVQNLILVLNGRSDEKIAFAKVWLDYLTNFPSLRNVAVVLLGDEGCDNDWILMYMRSRGGLIDVVFLVYDSPLVDNVEFFQWPLGVATYRGFTKINPKKVDVESRRPYVCSFLGTVYPKSSREELLHLIESHSLQKQCFMKGRKGWQPQETKDSFETYQLSLSLSDLTLNPVGMNSECYRIYEAMSYGSVPVIEDRMTPGKCDMNAGPLRLLKQYRAPVIYVKNWTELLDIMKKEQSMSFNSKVARRLQVMDWYQNFKLSLRENMVSVIKKRFFNLYDDQ